MKAAADSLKVHRSTLYRSDEFAAFRHGRELLRQGRHDLPRGSKDAEPGEPSTLEAWDESPDEDS
jgi:hypothetical protein